MSFSNPVTLGKTGLQVGRLGIASSFGAPTIAFEEAFERGCNYWTWGNFIRGRSSEMKTAIKNIVRSGRRGDLVLAMVSYAHSAFLTEFFLKKGLKAAGIEYADVLILGYFSRRPSQRVLDGALGLKDKGLVRFVGLTSHNRKVFGPLAKEGLFDVMHVRYNAVHRGAETETFPFLEGEARPGKVSFTATSWGQLMKPKKMPAGELPATPVDCYRFVLSNPAVDVAMMGAKNREEMQENLNVLDAGPMTDAELARMKRIGDYIHKK